MDYIIYNENGEAIVVESSEKEDLTQNGESRLEQYRAVLKEAVKKQQKFSSFAERKI